MEGGKVLRLFRNQRVDKSQVSEVQHRHSDGFACEAFTGSVHKKWAQLVGFVFG